MYSKEESKLLRKEFWNTFGRISKARKKSQWLLYNTKVKDVSLKFVANREICAVTIDIELRNNVKRHKFFESFSGLKTIFDSNFEDGLIWDKDYILENQKIISRISYKLENVDVYRKEDWPDMFKFLFKNMKRLEYSFLEHEDIIRDFISD